MKFLSILLLLILSSCAGTAQKQVLDSEAIQTNPTYKHNLGSENPEKFVVESESEKVDFIKVTKYNFNRAQKDRLATYTPIMNETLGSQCFEDFMLKRKLIQTGGRSNQEVIDHLRESTVEVELISYWSPKGTVGYTYPSVNKIWMNERLHRSFDSCRSASNLAHEGSHKIGYGHDYKRTKRRPMSVPYSINAAFSACCMKKPGVKPEKKLYCSRSWRTLWLRRSCYRR